MSNPIMFCDFLTRLYNIGEIVSVLALSSLFILMTQCGMEYSYFYQKVSSKETATRGLLRSHHLRRHRLLLLLLVASMLSVTVPVALGDIGTASYYGPPYDWTECYGEGASQFPKSNLFAAVGDEQWDMGDACGREYEVRCTSGCKPGSGTIRVKIVNYAPSIGPRQSVSGADLVLSQTAFEAIANPSMISINVEFKRV